MTGVIYLDDYKQSEEIAFRKMGLRTFRISLERIEDDMATLGVDSPIDGAVLIRGPKMVSDTFRRVIEAAKLSNIELITSERSWGLASNFDAHYPLIKSVSPLAIVAGRSATDEEILQSISEAGLEYPIFLRSDLESAAKYVGVEGCVLNSPADIGFVKRNLHNHVHSFNMIIAKQVVPLATTSNGTPAEVRAIGAKGKLLCFDILPEDPIVQRYSLHDLEQFTSDVLRILQKGGLDGAIFIDVALADGGSPIVVEIKDFSNGTISHPDIVAAVLKSYEDNT